MPDQPPIEILIVRLEAILRQMTQAQERLLPLMGEKREAMRQGEVERMAQLCTAENKEVRTLSELEKQRLEVVAALTLAVEPYAPQPLRMKELISRLPEQRRESLTTLRDDLREKLAAAKRETGVARQAATQLARHAQGLMQAMCFVATGTTYGRRGASVQPSLRLSTVNTTA